MKIDLAGNGSTALDLRSLHGGLHTLAAVRATELSLALSHHIHSLVAPGVESIPGGDSVLQHRQSRATPLLEPRSGRRGRSASLEEEIEPRDLRESRDLVGDVAADELNPSGGDRGAAERRRGGGEAGDAGGAVASGEVAAALESALELAGRGFGEPRFGRLLDQRRRESCEALAVRSAWIV